MRDLSAAFALALLCACAGYTNGTTTGGAPDGDVSHVTPDGGDGGNPDGGDGGDGGADGGQDAGCAPLTLNGVGAIDGCHGNAATSATGTVNTTNCTIVFSVPGFLGPCAGTVSGPSDAFDGGCEGSTYVCTSPSLPGDMTCTYAGPSICTVRICDAGACP